jgi:hypothetical protein
MSKITSLALKGSDSLWPSSSDPKTGVKTPAKTIRKRAKNVDFEIKKRLIHHNRNKGFYLDCKSINYPI